MSSNRKRKYGDLAASPIHVSAPSLLGNVFRVLTGRKPDAPAPVNACKDSSQFGSQSVFEGSSNSDGKGIQHAAPNGHAPPAGTPRSAIAGSGALRTSASQLDSKSGFLAIPNHVVDTVLPPLEPIEQVVLLRLYRLTRGFHKDTCNIGFGTLAKQCHISRSRAQVSINRLVALGYIQQLSSEKHQKGNRYRVNLESVPKPGMPQSGIPHQRLRKLDTPSGIPDASLPQCNGGVPPTGMVQTRGIPQGSTNKETENKKTQHTHIPSSEACVGATAGGKSAYSFDLWLEYTMYEQSRGQAMISPKAVAIKAFETGDRDYLMPAYLTVKAEAQKPKRDTRNCPTCTGTGWESVEEKGVRRCSHPLLQCSG